MQTGTIAFLLGVLWLQFLPQLPSWQWPLAALFLSPLFLLFNRRLAVIAVCVVLGFLWAYGFAQYRLTDSLATEFEGKNLQVVGVVASLPERDSRRSRFIFKTESATHQGKPVDLPARMRLSWYQGAPVLEPGQRWQLTVRLKRPWGMMNPGGFDYEKWLFQQGIRAVGYVRNAGENHLLSPQGAEYRLQALRFDLRQQLDRVLQESEYGGIVRALAIGDRSGISDEQWALFLRTGTNHLMAISGLHIGLVAGLVYWLVLWLWRHCNRCVTVLPAPRAAAVAAMAAALVYAALAGFSIPTQRAMLMLVLVMGAVFLMRPVAPLRILSVVLLLVLLHDPMVVLSAGFWLSFGAVALIFYGMAGRLSPQGLWWRWGRVQWLVALGLMPLLLLQFGQASVVAPVANLVAVPWIGFLVVPLTLLGTLLSGLWQAGAEVLLQLALWLTGLLWPVLNVLSEYVPPLRMGALPWWGYLLGGIGVAWLLAPRGWPMRWAGVVLILPMLLWRAEPPAQGTARFTLLDVGQGLAAVVETHRHTLVFDTGPRFASGFNTGSAVVVPFLQHQGRDRVDVLVVSHGDNDHRGGAQALDEAVPVGRLITSVPEKLGWRPVQLCRRGDNWHWDGVAFQVLHPGASTRRGNDDSCVLRVVANGQSLLLTGDIEAAAEQELLSIGEGDLKSDLLVVPHHGSKTSSSPAFIEKVSPAWALFPLGYRNRYGFPHEQVELRYQKLGSRTLATSSSGAISFILGVGELKPQEYRKAARRYWHSGEM